MGSSPQPAKCPHIAGSGDLGTSCQRPATSGSPNVYEPASDPGSALAVGSSPRESWSHADPRVAGWPASYLLDSPCQRPEPTSAPRAPSPITIIAANAAHAQIPTRPWAASVPLRPVPAAASLPSAPPGSRTTKMITVAPRAAAISAQQAATTRTTVPDVAAVTAEAKPTSAAASAPGAMSVTAATSGTVRSE